MPCGELLANGSDFPIADRAGRGYGQVNVKAIDIHAHFIPDRFLELVLSGEGPPGFEVEERGEGQPPLIVHDNGLRYPALDIFTKVSARLEQMDRDGIDGAILSVVPTLFMYDVAADHTAEVCRVLNDAAAAMAAEAPDRIAAMATVPMNDPALAAEELYRSRRELGLTGVEIGPSVGTLQLDDPSLDPFYAAAADLAMPIFIHPYLTMTAEPEPGLEGFHLLNVIGNPTETFIGISRLILGGVLDRHPDLNVILAHGGGAFPFQLGRLDHAFDVREETSAIAKRRPSEYLENIHFDTVVFGGHARRYLVDFAGQDHLLFGTDIPFDMGDISGREVASEVGEGPAGPILAGNAERLFSLAEVMSR